MTTRTAPLAAAPVSADEFRSAVDAHMLDLLTAFESPVAAAARAVIAAGGKRLRPLLVYAATPLPHAPTLNSVRAAAAVELIHTASMVHDDVLDGAVLRRGEPTVVGEHGVQIATACGDLLFAIAFSTLCDIDDEVLARTAVQRLADTARVLAEGEALQAAQVRNYALAPNEYERRCRAKTGVLFGTALALGAALGRAPRADVDVLNEFGTTVGVAFQIADDVLDCTADAATLGKEPGADVRDGTPTLPLLLAATRPDIASALAAPAFDTATVQWVLRRVTETGAADEARATALHMCNDAIDSLSALSGIYDLDMLTSAARMSVSRLT